MKLPLTVPYKGTELIKGGSTELYNEDILNYIRALI